MINGDVVAPRAAAGKIWRNDLKARVPGAARIHEHHTSRPTEAVMVLPPPTIM